MPSPKANPSEAANVFLNVPYDDKYEPILIALTAALVALGRIPRLTFEVADDGRGRLQRIIELINRCPISFHDLSAVELPVRFNMPFELGLACAIQHTRKKHRYFILEEKPYRLDVHLSDLKGVDPKIHEGEPETAIAAVLEVLDKPGYRPNTGEVMDLYNEMGTILPAIKNIHRKTKVFSNRVYADLVASAWKIADTKGFHK